MCDSFIGQKEEYLATIAILFAKEGAAREINIIANSKAKIEQTDYDNLDGGTYIYNLYLQVPLSILTPELEREKEEIQIKILHKLNSLIFEENCYFGKVIIQPKLLKDANWREKANNWLQGNGVTNQGRVRSDNIASENCDGLLFRSQAEINLYKALKAAGVSFSPLPVFIKGGKTYQRIEPDFVIVKDGLVMVVEVDGDTVHQETPAEAHSRTAMLLHEGVHFERIKASECETNELAISSAKKILNILKKLKATH